MCAAAANLAHRAALRQARGAAGCPASRPGKGGPTCLVSSAVLLTPAPPLSLQTVLRRLSAILTCTPEMTFSCLNIFIHLRINTQIFSQTRRSYMCLGRFLSISLLSEWEPSSLTPYAPFYIVRSCETSNWFLLAVIFGALENRCQLWG